MNTFIFISYINDVTIVKAILKETQIKGGVEVEVYSSLKIDFKYINAESCSSQYFVTTKKVIWINPYLIFLVTIFI